MDGPPYASRTEIASQTDRKESTQELAKNTKNNWTNFTLRTVRLLPADGPPGTGESARACNRKSQNTYPSMDLPTVEALEERFGEGVKRP
jgi:hypothetical protein